MHLGADFLGAKLLPISSQLGKKKFLYVQGPQASQHGFLSHMHMEKGQVISEIADTALLEGI